MCGMSNAMSKTVDACGPKQSDVTFKVLKGVGSNTLQPMVTSHSATTTLRDFNTTVSLEDLGSVPSSLSADSKISFSLEDRKCPYCDKQFQYMKDLKRHLPTHTGVKPYKCEVCGKCFGRPDKLGAHIKLHYKPKIRTNERKSCVDGEEDSGSERRMSIREADIYDANGRVNTDVFAAVEKRTATVLGGKQHMCSYCGKQFTRENNLTAHIRTHTGERPYVCFYCSKAFTRSERLKLHLRTHTGEKPYECQQCLRLFSRLHNLNRHSLTHMTKQQRESLQRKEEAQRRRCADCGKLFLDATRLKRHLPVHSGVKSHVCPTCGVAFTHLSNMKAHLRIHTGEKPFACRFCFKRFSKSSGQKRHEQQMHQEV